MKRVFAILPLIVLISYGCTVHSVVREIPPTSPPPLPPPVNSVEDFNAPFDLVWNTILDYLIGIDFEIKAIEKESGLIVAESGEREVERDYSSNQPLFKCPSVVFGHWWLYRGVVSIIVEPISEGTTRVVIRTKFSTFEDNVHKTWIPCRTKGVIEDMILDAVRANVSEKSEKARKFPDKEKQ